MRLIRYVVSQSHAIARREQVGSSPRNFFVPEPSPRLYPPSSTPCYPRATYYPRMRRTTQSVSFAWPAAVRLRREDAYLILAVALCNRSATAHQGSCLGMVHSLHTRAFPGILSGVW